MVARAVNPSAEEYPFNVGNVYNELDQKSEALEWYRRSLELNPRYESAWYNLAATNFMLNKNAEGCQALQKTLEINPRSEAALAQKGRCPNLQ
jgi:tetratricopeptide (TPR) repeat protein